MPPRLPDELRTAILADVQAIADRTAPERSASAVARAHGVAQGTVSKIARAAGLDHAWNRAQTKRAAEAQAVDNRARRAVLVSGLLDDVDELRRRFFAKYRLAVGGRDGLATMWLDEPPADAVRNYVTSAAVLIDKHVALERIDNDDGVADAQSMIEGLAVGLNAIYQRVEAEETPVDPLE